ncbi:MAG: iron-containing alcohol dehydrogenase [Bacteroidales bacterium]|nr:iron-containing alcohol dehydrogenase [Bacteroidales bacterium]
MNNFTYYNPTKIIFGENTIAKITTEIPHHARILITYGGGSIKQNGIHKQVVSALKGFTFFEFGGIEPNPQYSTLMKAVEMCRKEKIDFLLPVGGGSVLDGTKFIAAAASFEGEPWDILEKGAKVESVIPFGAILTLPATGSEMNAFAVISRKEIGKKLAFGVPPLTNPRFSVLDPNFTRSLSRRQRGNGVVDAFVHVTEQYLTYPQNAPLQDRYAESVLKTLIEQGPAYLNHPEDMETASNVMWSATMALNGLLSCGVIPDWATHSIGHELTALHGIDHARTLAIVWPGMMRVMMPEKKVKLLQFAERVWNITEGSDANRIGNAISATEAFFNSLDVPTKLSDYQLDKTVVEKVIENLTANGFTALGEKKLVTPEKVREILIGRL